ncbi:MAG: hypothetical protein V4546_12045 [Bacteroidota bacterium]
MKVLTQIISLIIICFLYSACQHTNRLNENSPFDKNAAADTIITLDTAITDTIAITQNEIYENNKSENQLLPQSEIQKPSSQNINLEETLIRPMGMSSSDGRGGSTSTYFRFYGNQVEKINELNNMHESYTIIDRKSVDTDIYFTLKGNNNGVICQITTKTESNGANVLIFTVPGEFEERYIGF